ncbi:MAG TPA: CheR family methyltransferase [Acidobacteriaceae bacterium]|nr:CheR family methyltransferase [Acidobacteriaceae bacterium]
MTRSLHKGGPLDATSLEERLHRLQSDRVAQLHRTATEAGTLHETAFLRDRGAFEALRNIVLPRLIAANAAIRRLRVWCAAVSTGQEAYSVAMLLDELLPDLQDWDVKIVGTDLSTATIEYARRGRYRRTEVNRGLPARLLVRHFLREGDEWEVKPELRRLCEFREADVCVPLAGAQRFDLVLLRNVLLQIPQADLGRVFANVHRQMAGDGVLMLGTGEQAEDWSDLFYAEFSAANWYYRPNAGE